MGKPGFSLLWPGREVSPQWRNRGTKLRRGGLPFAVAREPARALLTVCVVSVAGCFAVLPFFGLLVTLVLVLVLVLVLPLSSWDSRAAKLCDHAVS